MFKLVRGNVVEVEGAFSGFRRVFPHQSLTCGRHSAATISSGNTGIFHPRKPSNPAHRSLKKRNTLEALKITLEAATL
jgi:hypothetical protein